VDDLEAPSLSADDRHHLERVLRLRPGETITISDGQGGWRACRFADGGLIPESGVEREAPLSPPLTVGFAVPKGDRPEWIVQKLTEVGVDHIAPFVAELSVVRWDRERGGRRLDRLRSVARAAAMQSRRVWLPVVHDVAGFADVVAWLGPACALAEPGGSGRVNLAQPAVLVGPEGGFSPAELASGPPLVDLGPGVLRAETAAVASGVLLSALRAGVVGPAF
jgi:16S rRNA (uracil1498-N3)-methyltransferase